MSMTPESPLFSTYETQLDTGISELDFNRRTVAALDTIDGYHDLLRDSRLMLDAQRIGSLVGSAGLVDGAQISKAIYATESQGNTDRRPTPVYLTPAFDEITRRDIPCATRVAKLEPTGYGSGLYAVYRVLVMPTEQKTLPDGRGYYVAKSVQDSSLTVFRVSGEAATERETRMGYSWAGKVEQVKGADRQPVLDELEKAAAAVKATPRTQTRW
jgi:hypothetical protein